MLENTSYFQSFANANILVVGDVMLDRYYYGQTSRISPEAPVPVVHVGKTEEIPGGAGNVALNVSALGAQVKLMGICGNDYEADCLQEKLKLAGVFCDFHPIPGYPTITKLRVLSQHQQLIRLDFEGLLENVDFTGFIKSYRSHLNNTQVIILSDYAKGTLQHVAELIQLARAQNIPVLIDPKGNDFTRYQGATLLTPNRKEFEQIVGYCKEDREIEERGENLRRQLNLAALLITRGEEGMTLLQKEQAPIRLKVHSQEVYDVTGAGDTVIATIATTLAVGQPLSESVALANLAASQVVQKVGAATVTVAELQAALNPTHALQKSILNEEQLKIILSDMQRRGERIVMTNGCFDILHPGHIAYLEQAKRLGDRLIVAVNDDASVARLKGPSRPINSLEHRMQVLAGLSSVDWVVHFSEDTPARIIEHLQPDVLVKGGDYRVSEIAGAESVLKRRGEVKVLNFVEGYSTSHIIERCK